MIKSQEKKKWLLGLKTRQMKKRSSMLYNGCLKHATIQESPQKDGLQRLWQKIAKAVSSIAFLPMIEYRTARSSTYLIILEAIVAIVKAKRNDFRMCHGDENRCGIYIYELEPAGTYIILLPYGLILPSLREPHCSNIYIRIIRKQRINLNFHVILG